MGSRLLRRWLHRPLRNTEILRARHHCIDMILQHSIFANLYQPLRGIGDIERILARRALKSSSSRFNAIARRLGAFCRHCNKC
ncbi:MAG: hypothetical protein R3E08_05270 [Thiotrichaceae bacterium]